MRIRNTSLNYPDGIITKIYLFVFFISVIFVFSACEKEKDTLKNIQITTSKRQYSRNEKVQVEITNNSQSSAAYMVCSSYEGIPPTFYKLEGKSWTPYWSSICNGYSSYCCSTFLAGASFKEYIHIGLDEGIYRLEYQFLVYPSKEYESFVSSSFVVE